MNGVNGTRSISGSSPKGYSSVGSALSSSKLSKRKGVRVPLRTHFSFGEKKKKKSFQTFPCFFQHEIYLVTLLCPSLLALYDFPCISEASRGSTKRPPEEAQKSKAICPTCLQAHKFLKLQPSAISNRLSPGFPIATNPEHSSNVHFNFPLSILKAAHKRILSRLS